MHKTMNKLALCLLAVLISATSSFAQENPVEEELKKEGAMPTLPVSAAKDGKEFTAEFVNKAIDAFDNMHWQMGGDHALYYNMHISELMPTGIASPNYDYKPLERDLRPELENLKTTTGKGELTLKEYAVHPHFKLQAMIFIHKGKIVYETYPGMQPTDRKVWASSAKTSVGLIMAMLVQEGKVDLNKSVVEYVPALKGSVWDDVTVGSVVNMTTGLDNEETLEAIMNPESAVVRFFAAGMVPAYKPRETQGTWVDVARTEKKIQGEKQGELFRYASINTHVLTQLIENVENKKWTQVFEDRVWSKVYARQPAIFNIDPSGLAIPAGMLSTTPEDMARYATLFTPSWTAVASEQVVTDDLLKTIRSAANPARFEKASKRNSSMGAFNEFAVANAYQFDYIFEDGAMAKGGNMNQMIYYDPKRDFAAIAFANSPYHSGFGETKAPAYMRLAAKALAGE